MKVLDARETEKRLPYARLAESIRELVLARYSRNVQAPPRQAVPLPEGGTLLVMPASDGEIAITKLVTAHPGNAARGLPTIQGEVIVMEAATGRRLGVLEGGAVTARRTAALSLLAAKELAAHPEGPLLVVGAGTQGRSHLEAFCEGLGVSQVFITSRTRNGAELLARHAEGLGLRARVVETPEGAVQEARLIVTATTSRTPVLPGKLPPETFVAAVGAYRPEMAELPAELISSSAVVVDTLEGAREEAGDLIQAENSGLFRWDRATELESCVQNPAPAGDTPVVFKSVGSALWDLAAARLAFGAG